jgi:hypothetical protein
MWIKKSDGRATSTKARTHAIQELDTEFGASDQQWSVPWTEDEMSEVEPALLLHDRRMTEGS